MAESTGRMGAPDELGVEVVGGRFAMVPEALLMDPAISSHAVRVYGILIRYGTTPDDCYPTLPTIAAAMGASPRSVQAWVRELEAAGWARRCARPDGRQGYQVRTHREGARSTARPGARPTARQGRAAQRGGGALHSAPNESHGTRATNENPPRPPAASAQGLLLPAEARPLAGRTYATAGHDVAFDRFWQLYPRRVGKIAARKAWTKALRSAPDHVIIAGAQRFAADPNREPEYTPHPATWLNAGRWDDEPLPARGGRDANRTERAISRMAGGRPVQRPDLAAVFGQQPDTKAIGA